MISQLYFYQIVGLGIQLIAIWTAVSTLRNSVRKEMIDEKVQLEHRLTAIETSIRHIQRKVGAGNRAEDTEGGM